MKAAWLPLTTTSKKVYTEDYSSPIYSLKMQEGLTLDFTSEKAQLGNW